jgi:hypothetical protein
MRIYSIATIFILFYYHDKRNGNEILSDINDSGWYCDVDRIFPSSI